MHFNWLNCCHFVKLDIQLQLLIEGPNSLLLQCVCVCVCVCVCACVCVCLFVCVCVLYLALLREDLFVVQPALLAHVTESDGSQFRGGVAFGPGLLLSSQALQRLNHRVGTLRDSHLKMNRIETENT